MKRKIGLSESDLYRIVNRVIYEQDKGENDIEDDEDTIYVGDEEEEVIADYSKDEIEYKQDECEDIIDILEPLLNDLKSIRDSNDIFDLLSSKVDDIKDVCERLDTFVDGIESNPFGI